MPTSRAALLLLLFSCLVSAAGWQPLFDGKSLAGWRAAENPSTWKVVDGMLAADGPRSHLFYEGPVENASFRNFEFEAEVMTRPLANSGIYFHTRFQEKGWPSKGFEVQINNTATGEGGYLERKKTGSLYAVRNVYKALVKDNEWFKVNILVRGKQVQVRLNGVLVVDYVEPVPPAVEGEYKERVIDRGTFALQGHDPGSKVFFRNLRVRPLPDAEVSAAPPPAVDDVYRRILRYGADNIPMVDFHVHLKSDLTLEEALRRSRENGIFYGIAINGGLNFPVSNDAGLEPFLRQLDGQPVFKAFQAEGREWVRLFTRQALEKFDYIFTDSMTWTDDSGKRMRTWIKSEVGEIADPQKFMDTLVDRAVGILNNEPIDIYVNPTYVPDQLAPDYDRLWTPERMNRIVAALAANGVAMEINNRYRLPSPAFIRLAKQAGVKFACGTNNAASADLGRNEYCLEMIRECNLRWQDFWVPPPGGQKAIQRKPLPR
jgi:hypothetical protein